MPVYEYDCDNPACKHAFSAFSVMSTCALTPCEKCGGPCTINGARQAPRVEREWHGQETRSMSLAFDPSALKELRKDIPDAELAPDGSMVFRSDRHQRKVYKQIDGARRRIKEQEQESLEKRGVSDERELASAAAAIEQKYGA